MDDEDAEGDEEPLPIPKASGKKGAAADSKTKEKLFKVMPVLWSALHLLDGQELKAS